MVTLVNMGVLTLALLLANLVNSKNDAKKAEKRRKPLQMGTHTVALSKSFPMNTNMAGFKGFSGISVFLCL